MHHQLQISQKAFLDWKKTSLEERQKLLENLSKRLLENKEYCAEVITSEMHKPISQSLAEIEKCVLMIDFYAHCENVLAIEKIKSEFSVSEIHHEAMGVILGIMPWNFPFWQVLRFSIPTILAGNVVALKHASICQKSAKTVEKIFLEAGFPEAIFSHYSISHAEVEELLGNPIVKGVSLTGSEEAGRKIAEIAGKNLKKVVLELGGNDAFVVCGDADLEEAAKNGALGRLQNCGQTCVASKRFIIHEKVLNSFLFLFVKAFKKYSSGNPFDKETLYSQMSREDLAQDLENQYKEALENGAEIILPLERLSSTSFKPGILMMNAGNPMNDQELFGPLAMIFVGKNDVELLEIANKTSFGLGNSVWTQNKEKAIFFAQNLESGTVSINQITKSDPRFPFGGTKNSGYGVELSTLALKEFTHIKTVIGNV